MPNELDDFQQLGLGPGSTVENVEKNYKTLSIKVHPDKFNAASAQKESKLTLQILTRSTTTAELAEVADGNSIIFKSVNKAWLLCACDTELDITEEQPLHFFIQCINNPSALLFLDSLLLKQQKNAMSEIVRNELLLIAKAHGRTTLFEATSARFARLTNLRDKFNDPTTFDIYKNVCIESVNRLAKKTTRQPGLAQQIKSHLLATLDQNVVVIHEQYNESADNFKSFVRGWIRLVANFSEYLLSDGIINEQAKDTIIEFVREAISVIFKTYLNYIGQQVSLKTFSKGTFILSVLLESLTEHSVLLTKFIRQNMAFYGLLEISQLNDLQIRKIQEAMTTTDALVSVDTALLSMTLIEMRLSNSLLIENLIKNSVPQYDFQLMMLFLQEDTATEQRVSSSKSRKKPKKPISEHTRLIKSFYTPNKLNDLEKERLIDDPRFFDEVMNRNKEKNRKKLADITANSSRSKKDLIVDYFFCEIKNLLRIRQGYYAIMADSPGKINVFNVDRIKNNLTLLEGKLTSITNTISLVLLKKHIYPAFLANGNILKTTAKSYLGRLIDYDFSDNSAALKLLKMDSSNNFISSYDVHRKFLSWHVKHIEKITDSGLAVLDERLTLVDSSGCIIAPFLSYSQQRATQLLREINKILSLGTMAATPLNADNGLKCQMKSVSSFLNWYLDILARENPGEIKKLERNYLKLGDEFKRFKGWFEELGTINKRLNSLKSSFDRLEENPKHINITEKTFISWGGKAIHTKEDFDKIQKNIYSSQYIKLLIAMHRMQPAEKEKISIICDSYINPDVYCEIAYIVSFLKDPKDAKKIVDLIPLKLLDEPLTEQFDYGNLDSSSLKSLGSCLIALIRARQVKIKIQNYNFTERVARAKKSYHESQYYDFLVAHKEWLDHKVGFYQMLQKSVEKFAVRQNSLKMKLANLKKNTICINVDSGINTLQEELVRFNRYLKHVDKAGDDSFSLLKSVEDTFGELKHFRLEAFCSTKKMLKGITGDITLTACIKVRMDRLNMLAERVNLTAPSINVDGVPDETELAQLENKLSILIVATKKHTDDASNLKRKFSKYCVELSELKRSYEQQAVERQALEVELATQQQEFSQLCAHFETLFDIGLIDSQQEIIPELFKRIKAANSFISPAAPYSFIMTFKTKAQKITYLAIKLQQLSGGENAVLPIEVEKYDRQFNDWSIKTHDYLNNCIRQLLNNSHSLLNSFLKLNVDNTIATTVVHEKLSDLTAKNDSLLFQYRSLLELIQVYNYIGVNLSCENTELGNFYKTLRANQEIIDSINDAITQENRNTSCTISENTPTPTAKKNKSRRKPDKTKRSTGDSLVKDYQQENVALTNEFSRISRKVLSLKLKVERSKNTIETLLPKVTRDQGHDKLAKLLQEKIENFSAQIKSHSSTIASLQARSTMLVKQSLTSALALLIDREFMSQDDVEFLKSLIVAEDYSDLSLTEIENGQCMLQMDKKSGERLALTIEVSDALPNAVVELLTIAVQAQSRLLDRGWSMNQTELILDKIDDFLRPIKVKNPCYLESLQRVVKTTLDAKEKIKIAVNLYKDRASLEQKNQHHSEIKIILINLETKLDLLVKHFSTEPLLMLHLERLNIFAIRTMLINVITEQVPTFNSLDPAAASPAVVSLPDPDALALVPFVSNPSCFFADTVPINVASAYEPYLRASAPSVRVKF